LYLHAKRSVQQFMDWCEKYDPGNPEYVSIDITGFDGSQRGASLALEKAFFEFFNIPEDLVKFYIDDKLDAKTRSFHLGLMRLSGELFTWFFNTVFQTARTVTKYVIPPGDPMCGSGDDIQLFKQYPIRPEWLTKYQFVDICEEKEVVSDRGDFCSWIIKNGYTVRNPQLLFMRLRAAISRGKIKDVIDGYFLDFMSLFKQKDNLYNILTPAEMDFHNYLNNFFHNIRREVKINKKLDFNVEVTTHVDNELEKASFMMETFAQVVDALSQVEVTNTAEISAYTARVLNYDLLE